LLNLQFCIQSFVIIRKANKVIQ